MRIAHFVQRYPPALGGSEGYFARLSEHLAAAGDRVTVHTSTARDLDAFWSTRGLSFRPGVDSTNGVEVHRHALLRFPQQRRILKGLSLFPHRPWQCLTQPWNPLVPGMWRAANRKNQIFDAVHATAVPYGWPLVCGLRLARRQGIPFLITPFLHLGDPENPADKTRRAYLSPAMRFLLGEASRVFVQTSVEQEALLNLGFPQNKIILQGMGVDFAGCTGGNRRRIRQTWGANPDEVVVGHLANNSVEKGTVDLLKAAEKAWRAGGRFRLVLAGPEMPNFRTFWNRFDSATRVIRLGVLSDKQKKDFFAGIDLFALPSRSDSFGLVLLEAWAMGVPSVAYRAGGIAGVIRHEIDGLLVRCGDWNALGQALSFLIQNPQQRLQMGENGKARLEREFRWEDKLDLVRNTLLEVVSKTRSRDHGVPASCGNLA